MIKADIQFVRALADKRTRDEEGLFIAEGIKLIEEIQASSLTIRRIYTTRNDIKGHNVEFVERKDMERISQLKSASDCLAIVEKPRYTLSSLHLKEKLTLALDGVQNPGNLGTIIRLADWFGISDIVCSAEVIQATMGAILRVKVHYIEDLAQWLHNAAAEGNKIYGTLLNAENIYSQKLCSSGIIVMGNEGRGISDECCKAISDRLYIPPYPTDAPTSESLNVAMATAIILAEFRRPR